MAWDAREKCEKWGNCVSLTPNAWELAGLLPSCSCLAITDVAAYTQAAGGCTRWLLGRVDRLYLSTGRRPSCHSHILAVSCDFIILMLPVISNVAFHLARFSSKEILNLWFLRLCLRGCTPSSDDACVTLSRPLILAMNRTALCCSFSRDSICSANVWSHTVSGQSTPVFGGTS